MSDPVNVATLREVLARATIGNCLQSDPPWPCAGCLTGMERQQILDALGPLLDEVERYREGLQRAVDALTFYAGCFRAMGAPDTARGAEHDAAQALAVLTGTILE